MPAQPGPGRLPAGARAAARLGVPGPAVGAAEGSDAPSIASPRLPPPTTTRVAPSPPVGFLIPETRASGEPRLGAPAGLAGFVILCG